jgi:hypothetical protein
LDIKCSYDIGGIYLTGRIQIRNCPVEIIRKYPVRGIWSWASLLVYQWYDLSGQGSRKLGKEDENMPTI